jgi:hypothetical protein
MRFGLAELVARVLREAAERAYRCSRVRSKRSSRIGPEFVGRHGPIAKARDRHGREAPRAAAAWRYLSHRPLTGALASPPRGQLAVPRGTRGVPVSAPSPARHGPAGSP